ncbi:shikimate kinase [Dysgonomonadaceae bacterium PH5-43]|nr:shikimate kinase [Dysgonomonadaceae bacterium PH5-43]
MRKIFFIGYMGSGKTTIGRRFAEQANLQFVDLDLFIENRYHKTIRDIFSEKGEDGFREIERKALCEVVEFENVLISTGGGTPCFFNNMEIMNNAGTTVYLKTTEEELTDRLDVCKQNRPLIKDKTKEEIYLYVKENLEKREVFYNQASVIINTKRLLTLDDVDLVVNNLKNTLNIK